MPSTSESTDAAMRDATTTSDDSPQTDAAPGDSTTSDGGDASGETCYKVRRTRDDSGGGSGGDQPDGEPDDVWTYAYDAGNLVEERIERGDRTELITYEYDQSDRLVRLATDSGGPDSNTSPDGNPDSVRTYEYDDGKLVEEHYDRYGGGPEGHRPDGDPEKTTT